MNKKIEYTKALLIICACAAVGLGVTFVLTKGKIQQRADEKRHNALMTVLPNLSGDPEEITPESTPVSDKVYKGSDAGNGLIGYAAMGVGQGYSSKLKVMVGVDPSVSKVLAICVLYQNETPGLGTKVTEVASTKTIWKVLFGKDETEPTEEELLPWFQKQFIEKSLNQIVVVRVKDPDKITAITGATITTDAVVKAVEKAVEKIKESVINNRM